MIGLSDTTRRRIGYTLTGLSGIFVVVNVWVSISIGATDEVLDNVILGLAFLSVLVLSLRAAPSNGSVWALLWAAFFGSAGEAAQAVGLARTGLTSIEIETGTASVAPASLDRLGALALNVTMWAWIPTVFLLSIHLLIYFPSGHASSRRWAWLARAAGAVMTAGVLAMGFAVAPWVERPYNDIFPSSPWPSFVGTMVLVLLVLSAVALVHLVLRYRSTRGLERLQLKWVAWALAVNGIFLLLPGDLVGGGGIVSTLVLAFVPVSIGIAITRYRLFDIDVVISRSLVFVVLVAFITVVYAGLVVGVGSLVGGSTLGWQIVATALVAVVFEPVRGRVQRWINRLVLGRRATPYEVLSDLTGRLAVTEREEGLLSRMALRLAEGTGADRAIVWVIDGSGLRAVACEPELERPSEPAADLEELPGTVVPIRHDGETLGALSVESRRGDALTPTEQRLVEDLAGSAALLMRRLRLDADLERKADELAESRRRLVDAGDVERRRLERELDVGAQQQVLALKVQLGLAEQQARSEGAETAATLIAQITVETQDAIEQIRSLAHGIYPPLLEAEGLPAAINLLAEVAPVSVQVSTHVPHRYPLPVEGAIYFSVSEALTNAVKHGRPPIRVDVSDAAWELVFTVSDSGPGFDPDSVQRGAGLNNMSDRLDALEGSITIEAAPGTSTTVLGRVPLGLGVMT